LSQSGSQQSHCDVVSGVEIADGSILPDTLLIRLLVEKIEKQQTMIEKLTWKLDSVLSFMGISHTATDTVVSNMSIGNHAPDLNSQDVDTVMSDDTVPSYATVASHAPVSISASRQPRNLSDVVVTALYKEQMNKDRRSKSVVVNGFHESQASTDRESFIQLCSTELQIDPDVVYVKRIGSGSGTSQGQGRVRPLLVAVRTSAEAMTLVERSKAADRSTTDQKMRGVYINPNLSKAESKAAYEERCRRRSAAQRRGESRQPSSRQQSRSVRNDHISRSDTDRPEVAALVERSLLNPTASKFTIAGSCVTRSGT